MIFITVGTIHFPFLRMRQVVVDLASRKQSEEIMFQHGATPPVEEFHNVNNYSSLPYQQMMKYMKSARIIICHGGPATIFQALAFGKKPYVLPRKKDLGEHVDNHQVYFTEYLYTNKTINSAHDSTDIAKVINRAKVSHKNSSLKGVINYLDSCTNL